MLALSTLAALQTTGCIVADAPDYGSPSRSPIFMYNPVPNNPGSVQLLTRQPIPPTVAFGASVKSEDAGEQIFAALFFDYKHEGERKFDSRVLPPLTIETERLVSFVITPSRDFPMAKTCHTITLLVTHLSSWDQVNNKLTGPVEDQASVTWFASVDDDGTTPVASCPTSATETP